MVEVENELSIRSHHGMVRDLVPIYSFYQLLPNFVVLGVILWLSLRLGHFPPTMTVFIMLGWVCQYVARPCEMAIAPKQAAWFEAVLEAQAFYGKSERDGRWRMLGASWWQRWPHFFIEFAPGDKVSVIAPRHIIESLRDSLELMDKHGDLWCASDDQPFVFEPAEKEPELELPWQTKVPAAALGTACVVAFFWVIFTSGRGGMTEWGLSASALSEGKVETVMLHMFAHGGAMHLMMNMTVLAGTGPMLTLHLGSYPLGWLRFLLLFLLSGLAGAVLFLALHPTGSVPMVGASGALYGLIGLMIRLPTDDGAVLGVGSRQIRRVGWNLAKHNAFLFALLSVIAWTSGTNGGLAWEAHLGGFLFGLFVGPKLLPRREVAHPEGKRSSDALPSAG